MQRFKAKLELIGINPFVFVPEEILSEIFQEAKKDKGHLPICGTVNDKKYLQTLVKYSGEWRLYMNTTMLSNSKRGYDISLSRKLLHLRSDQRVYK